MNRVHNTDAKNLDIMIVKSISIYFENNTGVIVNVQGDEGFSDHVTSEPRASRIQQNSGVCDSPQLSPLRLDVPHGQWALLDADMPLLIDRSA